MNKKLKLFLFIVSFILSSIQVVSCTASAPVVYVSFDGTGDFNCNGTSDHIPINQALQFVANNPAYSTVHLKGPHTYVINDSIQIGSNTILEGDPTAVLKVADHAGWPIMKPFIKQIGGWGKNITIRGFEINGNYAGNSEFTLGSGYYNLIYITYSNDIKVYNMYMHDGMGDGLRANMDTNIQFYNNTIYKLGHDGLFVINSSNVEAWNNRITCRINSGLRDWNSQGVKFHDNVIDSFYDWSAGGPAIQIEKSTGGIVNNVEVYRNTIYSTYGPGIWLIAYGDPYPLEEAQNVYIHHNTFYSTGTNPNINWVGGIVASGFYNTLIENNVFDGVYHAAITNTYPETVSSGSASSSMSRVGTTTNYVRIGNDDISQSGATNLASAGYSAASTSSATNLAPVGSGYTTIVRNNIIVNTLKRTKNPTDTGYAVINYLPDTHTMTLEYNCLYNNTGGSYKNASSTSDIYVDPLFADQKNHNYYLKSKAGRWNGINWVIDSVSSPCIDAGSPLSDFSNEPAPNGGRINIGPHGNTEYASKSAPIIPTPQITGLTPNNGLNTGGNTVTIGGIGFTGATQVNFGSNAATNLVVVDDTRITVTAPAGTIGTVDVTVVAPGGTSATSANSKYTYNAPPQPTVTSLTPSSGLNTGGNTVTVSGTGFTGASQVKFGSNIASSLNVVSDTQITVTVPAGGTGTIDVTVTTPGGTSTTSANSKYTYNAPQPTVSSLTPSSGLNTGGNTVTVGGTGFTGATQVKFGTSIATYLSVVSDTQITVTAPAGTGTVDVTVTSPGGTSTTSTNSKYTYNAPQPTVSSLTPNNGLNTGGNTVTVGGTGFTGASQVKFGSNIASNLVVVSDTQITVTVPAGGTGTIDVTVTTPGGTSTTSANSKYTYNAPLPTVTSLSPNSGLNTGGNTVAISGTGFTGATQVKFGSNAATSLSVVSDTRITVTVPVGTTGTVDVTVTSPGGTSATSSNSKYIYNAPPKPTLTSLSPNNGLTLGGNMVTIIGTGFTGATQVKFGANTATNLVVVSDTQITVTAPSGTGYVYVTVTTPGGTSATSTYSKYTYNVPPRPAVASLTPNYGLYSGGNKVAIGGTGFTGATQVKFGTKTATNLVVVSSTQITVTAPSGTSGTAVYVTVTTPGGTSAASTYSKYTYRSR